MKATLRTKLFSLAAITGLAFVVLIAASVLLSARVSESLATIRQIYLPKLEVGPRLERQFEDLRRAVQDAVAARDLDALAATEARAATLRRDLAAGARVLGAAPVAALDSAIDSYHRQAVQLARRLVAEETGEDVIGAVERVQAQQLAVTQLLEATTQLDPGELTRAFESASAAQRIGAQLRLAITILCLVTVIWVSVRIGRGIVRSTRELTVGLERFGQADFSTPILMKGDDELAELGRLANRMAERLDHAAGEKRRADWQRSGLAGIAREVRGALEPVEVAERTLRFLGEHLDAPVGALYLADEDGGFTLLAGHGLPVDAATRVGPGEGLLARAHLEHAPIVVSGLPPDFVRFRSGLGHASPTTLVLTTILHLGKVIGVVELALTRAWRDVDSELMESIRETLAIALEVARARVAGRELLAETQRQAERLQAQEEELRARNDELAAQQEELRQTNEELTEQADELDAQRSELEERNQELDESRRRLEKQAVELTTISTYKSQFLTNMSHELRTPLNSMLLLSELLISNAGGNLTDKQVEFARTIHGAGKDLLGLINEVLDLAKIEAGRQEVRLAEVPLAQLAGHARRMFEAQAHDRGLELVVEVGPGTPTAITTDAQRLEQVLRNLLGNAVKFTERGTVALRIHPPRPDTVLTRPGLALDEVIALSVCDTGAGIPADAREKIFAPFEQLDAKSDRKYGGTGLGLAIARELCGLLGGELQLESTLGQGSTFTCLLPIAGPPASAAVRRAESAVERPAAIGAEELLLIVEDDAAYAAWIAEVARAQGIDSVIAPDGPTALVMARERRPGGIVLDVRLPGMDGFAVMKELRADPRTAAIPVHFLSAADAAERGLALGAVGYLTKPVERQDLIRMVGSFMAGARSGERRILVVEDDLVVGESLERKLAAEGLAIHRVTSASGAEAAIADERFACMILDLSLPDMDGLDLLDKLQRRDDGRTPPVVVYTARALSREETHRLERYTEAIVLKDGPSTERLVGEIRLFLRRVREGVGPRAGAQALHPSDVRLEGVRILVVDDDMRTVYALSATLRAKGAEVLTADTGVAALAELNEHPEVDAVLMDIMMPEMDGYQAMQRIRGEPRFATLPIIALTAKAMKGEDERCRAAGASAYLPKPIDAERLLGVLHEQLNGGDGGA